ncbi:sigma-70 family RNA polymerase sigma factor [Asticcacaulis sp. AND118]|uniref:sigma-70 family RNA polymerase sigma factor n=1 Tax=Asticcacaulis sp. AND118 TaxID=2840468 RepID=UPI001CFFE554|nr:sigma-70 family RNA polymerase sigma factor [Asticcacaulis sp. AND118]UDF03284.1 sigma-70 family RNA polymerase sigma factor [Asticcacaulis sp. AND118]
MLTPFPSSDVHVGARISERRNELNMSPERLARSLGVSAKQLAAYEAGRARISHLRLRLAAQTLRVNERYFYEGLTDTKPTVAQGEPWVREVDRWFADHIAPYERQYLWMARRILREDEAARDIVHDAYTKVLTSDIWKSLSAPRAYVMRIVFNAAVQQVRRAKVVALQALPDIETLEYASCDPDGFEAVSIREELRVGLSAIRSLPETTRMVITMRRLEGVPIKEIARILGMTVKGVDYHIARGAFLFNRAIEASALGQAKATGDLAAGLEEQCEVKEECKIKAMPPE